MGTVYLIPSLLHEEGISSIPSSILAAVKNCQLFFVENERTARRYLKRLWKEMVIDEYEWFTINNLSDSLKTSNIFKQKLKRRKEYRHHQRSRLPGRGRPGTIAGCHRTGIKRGNKTTGRSQLHLIGFNGQRYEWTAVSVCGLFANRPSPKNKKNKGTGS